MPDESEKIKIEDDAIKKIKEIAESINYEISSEARKLALKRIDNVGDSTAFIKSDDVNAAIVKIAKDMKKNGWILELKLIDNKYVYVMKIDKKSS